MFSRLFDFPAHHTTLRIEILAGVTTFLTMAYIIFVQPAVLSGTMFGIETGMDFGAVTTATCIAAAVATAIMGLHARYPIALAPGMGQNFFFVFTALPVAAATGAAQPWRVALGSVLVAGLLFVVLSLIGARQKLMEAVSPSMKQALAVGIGLFAMGTSTVTSYIESAAGVEAGGRTGLTALTVSGLFLLALFLYPVIAMIGSYPPITAPALVLVGAMMARNVTHITWDDYSEAIPAFLTVIGIPLFHSIADGLSLGLISYPAIKVAAGRRREVNVPMVAVALLLVLYFVFVRSKL